MSWNDIADQVEHPITHYAQNGDAVLIKRNKNSSDKDERVKRFVGSSEDIKECMDALHEVAEINSTEEKEQALCDAQEKCHRMLNFEGQYNTDDGFGFSNRSQISKSDE